MVKINKFKVGSMRYMTHHISITIMYQCDAPYLNTMRKLVFHFLSHWMGYDRGDSFPFDFEPNGIAFGSKSKGKLSPRS